MYLIKSNQFLDEITQVKTKDAVEKIMTFLLILLAILIIIALSSIKIVKQSEVYIIERLGKFHKVQS